MKWRAAALLLTAAACGGGGRSPATNPQPISVEALQADSIAHALVQRAFDADAALRTPDSLYIDNAEIVANGTPRAEPPRIAGVDSNGTIQLGSSRFAVTGNYVWGTIQYRWVSALPARPIVEGWATLVIGRRKDGAWRILHIHSSTVRDTA